MGGGGGSERYGGMSDKALGRLNAAYAQQRETLNVQVDGFLAGLLAEANAHDREIMRARLDDVLGALEDVNEVEKLLYGGSVAKNTAVDGISDVDAILILDREAALAGR